MLPEDDRGSVSEYARRAREAGKKTIEYPYPIELHASADSLEDAIPRCTVVLAELVGSVTAYSRYEIATWRKYKIIERLSSQPRAYVLPLPDNIPKSLLPVGRDEFLLVEAGGTVSIDGVEVTMRNPQLAERPPNRPHLLFLLFQSPNFAVSNFGSSGLFWLDESNRIRAEDNSTNNMIGADILRSSNGDLSSFRTRTTNIVKNTTVR